MNKIYLDALWDQIKELPQSPAHDVEHLERVLGFARELQGRYGGDEDVIAAAALLHDIGPVDVSLPSAESAYVAADKAEAILEEVKFPEDKIAPVCSAIRQHDQEDLVPDSIEAKILKEADFLAGFGAWGILRIAMFQGERGRGVTDVLQRLREKMPARIDGLEFPESRRRAEQEYLFVKLFLSLLKESPKLPSGPSAGKYISFEGISGSGKDTQAQLLIDRLEDIDKKPVFVSEPSNRFRSKLRQATSPEEELHILLADRMNMAQNKIRPSLKASNIVVASRSFVSSLVYQVTSKTNAAYIRFLHQSLPRQDMVIVLDLPAESAYERLVQRSEETGKPMGKNESPDKLAQDRKKFLDVADRIDEAIVIDGTPSREEIADEVWHSVKTLFEKDREGF